MCSTRHPLPLAYPILDDLPFERSGKIAGDQLVLLARYPTQGGVSRVIRRLEKPECWLDVGRMKKALAAFEEATIGGFVTCTSCGPRARAGCRTRSSARW